MLASPMLIMFLALAALAPASTPAVSATPIVSSTQAVAATEQTPLLTPQFRRYGIDEGLPSGSIYAVAQDRNGMMWFGSATGLARYDGLQFKVYRHVAGDPSSMPEQSTYSLFVDRDNRVWAGGISTGLVVYDQRTSQFRQWVHADGDASSLASDEVWGVTQTADGTLWVATQSGLDRMRPDGSGFDSLPLDIDGTHAESFGPTRALLADVNGRLWIGAKGNIYLREADGSVSRVPVDPAFSGDMNKIWRIDGGGDEVRVSVNGGLLIIGPDRVARPLANEQLASRRITSSTRDRSGRLWVSTADGVLFDDGDGRMQAIAGQPLLPGGLPGNKTWQTMLDSEGGLWITFEQASAAYLSPGWNGFSRFTHVPDDADSLAGLSVSAMLRGRDGGLWVGGEAGWVDKLDVSTGRVKHVVRDIKAQVVWLAEDRRGRLWIATPGELHVFERGQLRNVDLGDPLVTRPVMLSVADDDRIYVASWGQGLFVIDPDSLAISSVPLDGPPDEVQNMDQLTFHDGHLWYASVAGLLRWDDSARKMVFVPGVPRHEILSFAFDDSGIWLVTRAAIEHYRYGDGGAVLDHSIDISKEIFAPVLTDLRIDRQGQLWLFANPGLWRFDVKTGQSQGFGPSRGLLNADFNSGAVAATPNGMMFGASSSGVVAFRPEHVRSSDPVDRATRPRVTLSALSVRRAGDVVALPLDDDLVALGWRDRDLRVEARVASFIHPSANRYCYWLRGYDNGWVDGGSRGERDFTGLPAGEYTLDVRAAGADGVWGKLQSPVRIRVQAPPWLRWWA
ncbi:MAG: two-component regulator propeller domain-containing protein, partial [Rhodanobacter sp.]